jgi:hypothetical protein
MISRIVDGVEFQGRDSAHCSATKAIVAIANIEIINQSAGTNAKLADSAKRAWPRSKRLAAVGQGDRAMPIDEDIIETPDGPMTWGEWKRKNPVQIPSRRTKGKKLPVKVKRFTGEK